MKSWRSFFVAGAKFGEVGWSHHDAPRNVNDVSSVTRITHESHFWWAQYLVRLDGHTCCSAQCK